jgi:membrane complex biogenesis BtpA family protein
MNAVRLLPEWMHVRQPVIGMLHAPPLPGAPHYDGDWRAVIQRVMADAESLVAGGVHGVMLENFGDTPFFPDRVPAVTVAAMTVLACEVKQRCPLPLGINVLRNDGRSAIAIAAVVGARFIRVNVMCGTRVTDQGIINGIAHDLLRERAALDVQAIRILADVDVKHSAPLAVRSLTDETHDLVSRGGADAVIVSGSATGTGVNVAELTKVRAAAKGVPVLIGSGATLQTLPQQLPLCDGFIVGTAFKRDGDVRQPVDVRRVMEFVAAVREGQVTQG